MNQEIKARWVAALRSGEYPQAINRLRAEGGYCCLGVLCELAVADGVISNLGMGEDDGFLYGINPEGQMTGSEPETSDTVLPKAVIEWAGIERIDGGAPVVTPDESWIPKLNLSIPPKSLDEIPHELAGLNDQGMSFTDIADIIEEQL